MTELLEEIHPGEILFEDLISETEKELCYILDDDYLILHWDSEKLDLLKFNSSLSSDNAEEMSMEEMKSLLEDVYKGQSKQGKLNY